MSGKEEAVIKVQDLSYAYGEDKSLILDGISFSIYPGEILGIMGPSGCGKSTLCFCLGGIIPHSKGGVMKGDIMLYGQKTHSISLPQIATKIGLVFQDPGARLFLPRILNELAFGPENLCYTREEIWQRIHDLSKQFKIENLLYRNPNELSGGQQQLVAVASVLALDPGVLILDEAASQLDKKGQERLLEIIFMLRDQGKSIIMVDHNLDRLKMTHRLLALNKGEQVALGDTRNILEDSLIMDRCYSISA